VDPEPTILAKRYKGNPWVVAYEVRNEPHDYGGVSLRWGNGDPEKDDWALAATRAGNAVLAEDRDVLIAVDGLCFAKELRPVKEHQIELKEENRLVYAVHMYHFFQLFTAFSEAVMSWHKAQVIGKILFVLAMVGVVLLARQWWINGRPSPRGIQTLTVGCWMCLVSLFWLVYDSVMYDNLNGIGACNYVARIDVLPKITTSAIFLMLGICLVVVGVLHVRDHCNKGKFQRITCCCHEEAAATLAMDENSEESFSKHEEELSDISGSDEFHFVNKNAKWNTRLFIGCQCGVFLVILSISLLVFVIFADIFLSYDWFEHHMDGTWGFALRQGYPYTAPVWVSEMGASARSDFGLR